MESPKVGFVEAYKLFWLNYVNFKGRSRRSEYWWVALWHVIVLVSLILVGGISILIPVVGVIITIIAALLIMIYGLAIAIPNLSLLVRRFHDIGWSMAIPIVSFIVGVINAILTSIEENQQLNYTSETEVYVHTTITNSLLPEWLSYIMLILSIVLSLTCFIVTLIDSKTKDNKYGQSPKYGHNYVVNHGAFETQQGQATHGDMPQNMDEEAEKKDPYRY
ncbi:DUF805 domain-containing protein [Staphylococcus lutrae]|uniref:DUF805 domain-containing protein n=1 Tax=Staphylococcus lutrae TaxID=155085 RepID=A0AAC9RTI6_9STAP|nr:DUF805 domain-containing protein [Staphylococcus lutrae]ARJ50495.1 hypothetical protein B5P37_03805 [Staphylococcus lutrae]PNZ37396.1 DUF805 domain-containing protein [Staphylococcus lutrae]